MKQLSGIEKISIINRFTSKGSLRTGLKRIFDLLLSILCLIILSPFFLFVAFLIRITSKGPVFNISKRIGIKNKSFKMYKFRSMEVTAPDVATHLLKQSDYYLTSPGSFLRKTSLDELPQMINILKGEMSFVGPRPALHNQHDLIELRTNKGIHKLLPGLTGWAQINGRDSLDIPAKAQYDEYYLKHQSFFLDLKIILKTLFAMFKTHDVDH